MTPREFFAALLGVSLLVAASGAIAVGVCAAIRWEVCR